MHVLLFDTQTARQHMLPLSATRPLAALRCGILTLYEKWEQDLGPDYTIDYLTPRVLHPKYPHDLADLNLCVFGAWLPGIDDIERVKHLKPGQILHHADQPLAMILTRQEVKTALAGQLPAGAKALELSHATLLNRPYDLVEHNAAEIGRDLVRMSLKAGTDRLTDPHTVVYGADQLYVAEGVITRAAVLNAENGPIYLGPGATLSEQAVVVGPAVVDSHAEVRIGAKIRPNTTIGPHCKAGGEIANSILTGYTNKAHDGYLGNSVLGQWCNLGADTNTSNLKNTYSHVKLWNYATEDMEDTASQYGGLVMGDHAKAGINTMFNTGTCVGVAANVFGAEFPPKFVADFAWGGGHSWQEYQLDKALQTARRMMNRRTVDYIDNELSILSAVFVQTAGLRKVFLGK